MIYFGVGTKPKNVETSVQITHTVINIWKKSLYFWKGAGCSGLILKKYKYLWRNVHHKMADFLSVFWNLPVTMLIFNSPTSTCRLGNHEVWIRYSPLLKLVEELSLHYYFKLKKSPFQPTSLSAPRWRRSPPLPG